MATLVALPLHSNASAGVYLREIGSELTKLRRNRAYSLSVIGFPVAFYLMFSTLGAHSAQEGREIARYLLASYSCFGTVGAALFGVGCGLAIERGHGWLELKRASPMPPMAYLVAKLVASLVFSLIICLLLVGLGPLVAHQFIASPVEVLELLAVVAVGTIPFASLGLLFGLAMPPNAGPGLVNLIYLPLSFVGGLWMPVEQLPHWLQGVAQYTPTYWFSRLAIDAIFAPGELAAFGSRQSSAVLAYAVLAGYTAVLLGLSVRVWARSEAKA